MAKTRTIILEWHIDHVCMVTMVVSNITELGFEMWQYHFPVLSRAYRASFWTEDGHSKRCTRLALVLLATTGVGGLCDVSFPPMGYPDPCTPRVVVSMLYRIVATAHTSPCDFPSWREGALLTSFHKLYHS